MAKLIYSMITSLDGYAEAAEGGLGTGAEDPEVHTLAIAAGLVDEYHLFITTSVVGGGKRFFPDGVRLDLELVEERAFDSGLIYAGYRASEDR